MDVVELQRLLHDVNPGVLLVEPRVLRRVIRRHLNVPGLGLQVPHRKSIVLTRDEVLGHARAWELGVDNVQELPDQLILITRPDPDRLAALATGDALLKYWRLIFHASVHRNLDEALRQSKLTGALIRQRISALGQVEFNEIRQVLGQEKYFLPLAEEDLVYVEFSAVFWELRFFAPHFLPAYFPGLPSSHQVEAILKKDLDAYALFQATRLKGALEPGPKTGVAQPSPVVLDGRPVAPEQIPEPGARAVMLRRATRARSRGNLVRSAILNTRAQTRSTGAEQAVLASEAANDLNRLVMRLQRALGSDNFEVKRWRDALTPLLAGAANGLWPVEARLLYDLQKVCIDSERKVHTVDVMGWLTSFGRRRIVRLLPHHQEVMLLRDLRRAAHRATAARISADARSILSGLLVESIESAQTQLRERVRPLLLETLAKAGMHCANYPEKIAFAKLVEELLDFVVERGYLNMADLRDAISRNNLKLSDLSSLDDLVRGDLLLRSSRRLRSTLDGVYHHGEFYLRWMQRMSSIGFGTRLGRLLTLYLLLPFGGSYVILHGLHHIVSLLAVFFVDVEIPPTTDSSILLLGILLFALINFQAFRSQVRLVLLRGGEVLHALFVEFPAFCLRLGIVQSILGSTAFRLLRDFVFKPLVFTSLITVFLPLYGFSQRTTYITGGVLFGTLSLLLNTFLGRHMEEALTDALARTWRRLHLDVLPAVLRFVLDLFRQMLEGIERFLYTVDEWLRFRTGESRLSLVLKGALGVIWFFVTYFVRIYVNILIEPTVNPIKHFPVVTVGAKLILPFYPLLVSYLAKPFMPLGHGVAYSIASINFILIPGVFGFLLWELKENWRLYEANRPPNLRPVQIGHHGETMVRLLRLAFHSGTIPKTYARLRRSLRKTGQADSWTTVHKQEEALQRIADRLGRFLDREFVALLNDCRDRDVLHLHLQAVQISTNKVLFTIANDPTPDGSLAIEFVEQSGWLTAGIVSPGLLEKLGPEPAGTVKQALLGLYKLAGVDLLLEQVRNLLEPSRSRYELAERQIKIWPSAENGECIVLNLREGVLQIDGPARGCSNQWAADLGKSVLLFRLTPITWKTWIQSWQEHSQSKSGGILNPSQQSLA